MTTFPDLRSFEGEHHHDTLELPIGGKTYVFAGALSLARGIQVNRIREEARRGMAARQEATDQLVNELGREPTQTELLERLEQSGHAPRQSSIEILGDTDEMEMYLDLIGADNLEQMKRDRVTFEEMVHVGSTLFAWHMAGSDAAEAMWRRAGGDVRPPVEGSASSSPPTTSPTGSTPAKPNASKPRTSRGRTTSTGGRSSKQTSTASTTSTSRTRKSTSAKPGGGSSSA